MQLDSALVFYGSFAVSLMYIFSWFSLLPAGRYAKRTLVALVAVFVIILASLGPDHSLFPLGVAAGATPVFLFAVYALLVRTFIKKLGRAPVAVMFNRDKKLPWDRLFALTVTLGFVLPTAVWLSSICT